MFLQLGISSLRRAGSDYLRLFVCAVQPANRIGANGPRDLLYRGVLLAFAHFSLEGAADERAFIFSPILGANLRLQKSSLLAPVVCWPNLQNGPSTIVISG